MIERFILFFGSLPNTSQAAIIASSVTLIGAIVAACIAFLSVYLTHRGNEKRFAGQLEHDRTQKRTEREMSLRKEVYLDAAEAVVAGIDVIGRYVNLKMPDSEINSNYSAKRGAIAKIHLIGSEETVSAVFAFTSKLDSIILNLALHRAPLTQIQAQLKILEDQISTFSKERDRMTELMKQLNFEGSLDTTRWTFVNKTFEFEQQRIQDAIQAQKSLGLKLNSDWVKFVAECQEASASVTSLLVPAIKAIRDELQLPFDETYYRHLVEESIQHHQELIKHFQDSMEQSLNSQKNA